MPSSASTVTHSLRIGCFYLWLLLVCQTLGLCAFGLCPGQPSTRFCGSLRAEQASHSEPGSYQLGVIPGITGPQFSLGAMGTTTPPAGDPSAAGVLKNVWICIISPLSNGPSSEEHTVGTPEMLSKRGNEHFLPLRERTIPVRFPSLLLGGHVAFLRVGVGSGRRCPHGPAPSGRGGRGKAPRRRRPAPRGVGVADRAPHKVCFLPPGGWGRARRAPWGGEGI